MGDLVLEIEGESLEEVRAEAKAKTPPGLSILNEKIIANGETYETWGEADTAEEAAALAKSKVPTGATIVKEKLFTAPGRRAVDTEAWDEAAAGAKVKNDIHSWERIESIILKTPGRKGMLGMGKAPGVFSATVFQPAIFEITYKKEKTRIRVVIGERKHHPSGFCQFCGKADVPVKVVGNSARYFCSPACEASYDDAKVLSSGSGAFKPINVSGKSLSFKSGSDISGTLAKAHCWRCGRSIEVNFKNCPKCGQPQN
jgi:hypothetical protein